MRPRSALVAGSAVAGVARLVLLLIVSAGFFAMHGLAATDGGGAHHGPAAMTSATGHGAPVPAPAPEMTDGAADHQPPAAAPAQPPGSTGGAQTGPGRPTDDGPHGLMAGCVFVLASVLLLAATGLTGVAWPARRRPVITAGRRFGIRPARSPPRPVYLSLCLLRL